MSQQFLLQFFSVFNFFFPWRNIVSFVTKKKEPHHVVFYVLRKKQERISLFMIGISSSLRPKENE